MKTNRHFRRIPRNSICAAVAAVSLLGAAGSSVRGQTFNVTNANVSGNGSLFSAIQAANNYGNGAIINIQNSVGTINASQLPDITVGVTINGGTSNTLSGQNQNRIFFINAPGQSVNITNLTLGNGLAQGGNGGHGGGSGGGARDSVAPSLSMRGT